MLNNLIADYHVKAFNVFVRAFHVDTSDRLGFLSYLNACQMLRHLAKARLLQFVIRLVIALRTDTLATSTLCLWICGCLRGYVKGVEGIRLN